MSNWPHSLPASRTRGLRRQVPKIPCPHCAELMTPNGMALHEPRCMRLPSKDSDEHRCQCGDPKPRATPSCWRCAARDPRMLQLDELLRDEIKPQWRGRVAEV